MLVGQAAFCPFERIAPDGSTACVVAGSASLCLHSSIIGSRGALPPSLGADEQSPLAWQVLLGDTVARRVPEPVLAFDVATARAPAAGMPPWGLQAGTHTAAQAVRPEPSAEQTVQCTPSGSQLQHEQQQMHDASSAAHQPTAAQPVLLPLPPQLEEPAPHPPMHEPEAQRSVQQQFEPQCPQQPAECAPAGAVHPGAAMPVATTLPGPSAQVAAGANLEQPASAMLAQLEALSRAEGLKQVGWPLEGCCVRLTFGHSC